MDQGQHLEVIHLLLEGMANKDRAMLEEAILKNALLFHMTGRSETREEYIQDILDGTLNYYDYRIIGSSENEVKVRLLAKVYGGNKSWWTLAMSIKYTVEDNLTKIKENKVRMA